MKVVGYSNEKKAEWDLFIKKSCNGTFLLQRDFMDYHSNVFIDASLMFYNDKDILMALFPANIKQNVIISHAGLTYGGIIVKNNISIEQVEKIFNLLITYYKSKECKEIIYKSIPYIYHIYPFEADLYILFRLGAFLSERNVSSVIDMENEIFFSKLRIRKRRKAETFNIHYKEGTINDLPIFWEILKKNLQINHNVTPVHSLDDIMILFRRFPDNIFLFIALDSQENIVAGTVLFKMKNTVHTQYIAASNEGKNIGALDYLFWKLIHLYKSEKIRYFDFGISTENKGKILNYGLIFQKEGFGGRPICYDKYQLNL